MGVVYLARDAALRRKVAVKVLADHAFDSSSARELFLNEARLAASLDEPHVIPIYEVGQDHGVPYLAMRYVDSGDLRMLLIRDGRLDPTRVATLAWQVGLALDAAHAHHLVHRDVKPGNVLVASLSDGQDHFYLSDFGLARVVSPDATDEPGLAGTVEYMAPEQIRGVDLDAQTDVYALGCVLYQCLTGSPPYSGSEATVLWQHLESEPPAASQALDDLPAAVDPVLARALAKVPAERYPTCRALADALAAAIATGSRTRPAVAGRSGAPVPAHRLIGRRRELSELGEMLRDPSVRLVTVTGPGGAGKTRLAIELSRTLSEPYPDGVWFVELAGLTDPALLMATVASAVGMVDLGDGVADRVASHLAQRRALLVLDNCEHLLAAAEDISKLIANEGASTILITARTPLQLSHEREYAVAPLPLPGVEVTDPASLIGNDAIALFVERAATARGGFRLTEHNATAVAAICDLLDGLPLAIELAAARIKLLAPAQLLERLTGSLALLAGAQRDAPERQRSLRATIDWSHQLLGSEEQRLFAQLSVFVGEFTLAACEAVATAGEATLELLDSLTQASLVRVIGIDEEPRFGLLQTVRRYAAERLVDRGEAIVIGDRHLAFHRRVTRDAAAGLRSSGHAEALRTFRECQADIRSAFDFALHHGRYADAAGLALDLADYWDVTGAWMEGQRAIDTLLTAPTGAIPEPSRSLLMAWQAQAAVRQGELREATRLAAEAVKRLRQDGDRADLAFALQVSGSVAFELNDLPAAERFQRETLEIATTIGDSSRQSLALCDLANSVEDPVEAARLSGEALDLHVQRGDRFGATLILLNQVGSLLDQGDYGASRERLEECREHYADVLDASPMLATQFFLNRGLAELGGDQASAAVGDLRRTLLLACEIAKLPFAVEAAEALVIALADSDPELAGWLDGLASHERGARGLQAADQLVVRTRASALDRVSERLGVERLRELKEDGEHASMADAVAKLAARTGSAGSRMIEAPHSKS